MSSAQPPVMYTVSLWSMPFETGAPTRLLQAQERELLKDLRHAVDKRIENKIASARRFAVSVLLCNITLTSVVRIGGFYRPNLTAYRLGILLSSFLL